jgi:hypothetical protein
MNFRQFAMIFDNLLSMKCQKIPGIWVPVWALLSLLWHFTMFSIHPTTVVWDVGHQAYGHKILTGRRDQFHTNRQFKGLCGFPSPKKVNMMHLE